MIFKMAAPMVNNVSYSWVVRFSHVLIAVYLYNAAVTILETSDNISAVTLLETSNDFSAAM